MKLLDFLPQECIIEELNATNKNDVLAELARVLSHYNNIDKNKLISILKEREKIGSTGIGNGVAIPHGKYPGLTSPITVFGRSTEGIGFDAIDEKKVHFFCLLVAPEHSVGDHLKALARISRMFKKTELRKMLLEAKGVQNIWTILSEADETL